MLPQLGGSGLLPSGTEAVGLDSLQGLLERQLANPTRFDLPAVQQAYGFLGGQLEDQAQQARQSAVTDAQSRGVFFGSPLSSGLGRVEQARQQGLGTLASNVLLNQAQTGGQDQQAAFSNAFRFLENAMANDQFNAQLGLSGLGLGLQGAPSIGGAVNAIASQQLPGAPQGGNIGQLIASILGQGS